MQHRAAIQPRVLITGFDPFDGMTENLSARLVHDLESRDFGPDVGIEAVFAVLPVRYGEIRSEVMRLLNAYTPSVVLAFGIGRGDALITIERVALNLDDAESADNSGEIRLLTQSDLPVRAGFFHLPRLPWSRQLGSELERAVRIICRAIAPHGETTSVA